MPDTCLSGGAKGSDLEWGNCARKLGHQVIHYSFKDHYTTALRRELVILTPEQLREADEHLANAAPKLKKYYSKGLHNTMNDVTRNLLRRNWWQVKDADRVYAIRTIKDGIVQGGTAWAVQMFIDRHNGQPCEAYVYDQEKKDWFAWSSPSIWSSSVGWQQIIPPPRPYGRWAGIGIRDLNQNGKNAIRDLMGVK